MQNRVKSFFESVSSIKLAGINYFVIIDLYEDFAGIALIKDNDTPLRLFYKTKLPRFKYIEFREIKFDGEVIYLKREIDRLLENNRINNAALIFIINRYKYFEVKISRESLEDSEVQVYDLLKKQLPENITEDDFILNYQKISGDDSFDTYLATVTRKQEMEPYIHLLNNPAIKFNFAVPFIFAFAFQPENSFKINDLVEFNKERIKYFYIEKSSKCSEEEYYLNSESQSESEEALLHINENILTRNNEDANKHHDIYVNTRLEYSQLFNSVFTNVNKAGSFSVSYKSDRVFKHNLTYNFLYMDLILDFLYPGANAPIIQQELEKKITTRLSLACFGILLGLLLLINGLNLLTDNMLEEISYLQDDRRSLETQINDIREKNNQIKNDWRSLKQIKYDGDGVSQILKLLSATSVNNLVLTDIALTKNGADGYSVKINGESGSRDEVISLIRNLELVESLSGIELVWLDKKTTSQLRSAYSNSLYNFSININYNENKKS